MKRTQIAILVSLGGLLLAASTAPLLTRAVNVGTTPTVITASPGRTAFLLQNQGPNPEWCQLGGDGGTVASGTGIQLNASGGSWGMNETEGWPIWCVTTGAAQVNGGSTLITETR